MTNKINTVLLIILGFAFAIIVCIILGSRFHLFIPKYQAQCLNYKVALLDKWDKSVEKETPYAFLSKNMVIYKDNEVIAKIFVGAPFDKIEINSDENILINNVKKGHGLQMAEQLHHQRSDFVGKAYLEKDQYFGLGTTWTSYDSRYWGAINEKQILGRLYMLL